jgi:hypothetical protein
MLFSPVYTEAHPRRSAAFAARMNLRDASPAATGYSVCKLVTPTTPTHPTGTLYPFSFQSLAEPYSPSCSNGTPSISFNFILLQTLSLTTDGYTPLPSKKVQRVPSEAEGYPVFSAVPTSQDPEIRPGRSRSSLFTDNESPACPERSRGATNHGSQFLSPVPLRPRGHGAKMLWNVVVTPHRETSPLLPVSKSMSRADAGCGNVTLPIPGQVSCRKAGWPGKHPQGCGIERAGKAGSVRLGQHALLES